jgi:methylenetetrahydrofolate dehydrogenase (NADP+)/methenyltetrahydrofolate cyclohydrolase
MAKLIDGKLISTQIKDELKAEVAELKEKGITPCLAVIQVGNDPASSVYVNNKKKACAYIGIESLSYELEEKISQEALLDIIEELNYNEQVNGILVQLPLPKHIDEEAVIQAIVPEKDVDGFHPETVGNMCIGSKGFLPCTPAGVIQLLKRSDIEIEGKECVVVGRSNIVGKPMAILLLRENGTVTITHSRTKDLKEVTKRADILVAAIGKPKFITADYIKEGAVVYGAFYLSGDVAIREYKKGYILDEEHNLALLRYTFQEGAPERLRGALSEKIEYFSEWVQTTFVGIDNIIERFKYVNELNPDRPFFAHFATITDIVEGAEETTHAIGERCIVIAVGEEYNLDSICFMKCDAENKISRIEVTRNPRYRFELDEKKVYDLPFDNDLVEG